MLRLFRRAALVSSNSSPVRRGASGTAIAALVAVALVGTPIAASAHPADSEPQTMSISAKGADVTITWNAATDELGVLADVIGLGDGGQFLVFDDGALNEEASSPTPQVTLAAAPEVVESYFTEHVVVTTAGDRCTGELQPLGEEVTAGITLIYHCDREVGSATVYADTLMDVDPRYVIAAGSATGENRLFTDDTREFTWVLATLPDDDRTGPILYGVTGALVLLALAGYFWRRRRSRTTI